MQKPELWMILQTCASKFNFKETWNGTQRLSNHLFLINFGSQQIVRFFQLCAISQDKSNRNTIAIWNRIIWKLAQGRFRTRSRGLLRCWALVNLSTRISRLKVIKNYSQPSISQERLIMKSVSNKWLRMFLLKRTYDSIINLFVQFCARK